MVGPVGVIGLGRMGGGLARRLSDAGFVVHGYDPGARAVHEAIIRHESLQSIADSCEVLVLSLPVQVLEAVIAELLVLRDAGRAASVRYLIDGGNSLHTESRAWAMLFEEYGISFVDVGISGGLRGAHDGYALMVGGDGVAFHALTPLFAAWAQPEGILYCGPAGAGHYVKMVHNGIEYGIMQSYAEGFELLLKSADVVSASLEDIARCWQRGSIIRSYLLDVTAAALADPEALLKTAPRAGENGTGRWTLEAAHERIVSMPQLEQALLARARSRRGTGGFAAQLVAQMRARFGGHAITERPHDVSVRSSTAPVIDISWPITDDMVTYKDGEKPEITVSADVRTDGVMHSRLRAGLHTGTHIDAPAHFIENGSRVADVPLDACVGYCQVLDLTACEEVITVEDLFPLSITAPRVLLKTRNSNEPATGQFDRNFVYLSAEAAEYLALLGTVRLVGIDALGIERTQPGHETHTALFEAGIVVLEGLRLGQVFAGEYMLSALPLSIPNAEASFVRAVLF